MSNSSSSPLPRDPAYIAATRQSCASISTSLGLTPDAASIDRFLRTLDQATYNRLRTQHGLAFPLRFPTPTAEINFIAILSLLNALSGYRTAFHKATGAGAYQNIVRLMIGLYISGGDEDRQVGSANLTAKGMRTMTEAKIVELLGVSVHEERPHDSLPGVTVGIKGGEMNDAVQLILTAMQNVGRKLTDLGVDSMGAYLEGLMAEAKQKHDEVQVTDYLVAQIAQTFPEFCDTHTFSPNTGAAGQEVYIFKRIFFLLHALYLRCGDKPEYGLPNTYTLPMFVDNVLPTLCVWLDLISTPDSPSPGMETLVHWIATANCNADLNREKLDDLTANQPGPGLTKDETYAVRAATLNVATHVVARAHALAQQDPALAWLAALNEVDLDGYLWSLAKDDPALRKVPRLVFPSIHF
ncbi:uncharacterized protein PAN0_013c4703 [Moesziomyces antarcticus]|uniref:Uncharacterized protein n=2 Tax=Pseudozyma antarctica TaxID=84753 RepID=A0A5C3FUT3_PSEA2|nr:uncharacterized protein PAN0_013c4703 [Moesziomyces antarcticus]GAK66481.1 conserved hypothetical protein [Moesziomyces antarcticus]SPO47525.1 uncharacterized protein PSANT_05213 [Moesziomyces antarcticus]